MTTPRRLYKDDLVKSRRTGKVYIITATRMTPSGNVKHYEAAHLGTGGMETAKILAEWEGLFELVEDDRGLM